jgi:hypothetical protein
MMPILALAQVLVVARGEPTDQRPDELRRIREAVAGANVLLVAPALPVPGERWIVDLDAREARTRSRVERWIGALADHASKIATEIGDADPRVAVADALREFPLARVIDAGGPGPESSGEPGRLTWLAERYGLMPGALAAGR